MNDQPATPTALITGASSGIGQQTAQMLAHRGYHVFGTSRRDRADEHGVTMLRLDVRSEESVTTCLQQIHARTGRLDLLVNNAGVMHEGFAEETTISEATEVFDTNLFGAARVINAALPSMRAQRRGRIINVGSLAAWVGEPGEAFYAASKAALARYTEALRHEVWHLGISVSLVEPGAFTTNVLDAANNTARRITDYDGPRETSQDVLHKSLRNGDDPHKVAELLLRIARAPSPKLRYGAGHDGRWLPYLKTLIPQRAFDQLLRRSFHLPNTQRHETLPET